MEAALPEGNGQSTARRLGEAFADLVLPPLCEACCLPFDLPAVPGTVCGACICRPPPFRRTRAVMQ